MSNGQLQSILTEFVSQHHSILDAVLVLLLKDEQLKSYLRIKTTPMQMETESVRTLAATMLVLADRTRAECHWPEIEQISVRSPEGYIMLATCSENVFLLVKASDDPAANLESAIERTVRQLRVELTRPEIPPKNYLWK